MTQANRNVVHDAPRGRRFASLAATAVAFATLSVATAQAAPFGTIFIGMGKSHEVDTLSAGTFTLTQNVGGLSGDNIYGFAFDAYGNTFMSDNSTNSIVELSASGAKSTFASGISSPHGLAFDSVGNLVVLTFSGAIKKIAPGGTVSTFATVPVGIGQHSLAIDSHDNLYATDYGNNNARVYKVTSAGTISTFISGLNGANGLAVDSADNLFVLNAGTSQILKVTPGGTQSVYANTITGGGDGLAIDASGDLFMTSYALGRVFEFTPGGASFQLPGPQLNGPIVIAVDNTFIPEPASFAVLGAGMAGVLAARRRQRTRPTAIA